jgi:hypothetical protein
MHISVPNLQDTRTSVFFIDEFLQRFDLKNVILTNTKEFSWEKWSKFAKFQKDFFFKSPDLYNKFQEVAKNIEGSRLVFYFHIWHVARIGLK